MGNILAIGYIIITLTHNPKHKGIAYSDALINGKLEHGHCINKEFHRLLTTTTTTPSVVGWLPPNYQYSLP